MQQTKLSAYLRINENKNNNKTISLYCMYNFHKPHFGTHPCTRLEKLRVPDQSQLDPSGLDTLCFYSIFFYSQFNLL